MTVSKLTHKKNPQKCEVDNCDLPVRKKNMCGTHYHRIRRNGTTERINLSLASLPERFWCKVDKTDSCWLWTASDDGRGYGKINFQRKTRKATHIVWFLTFGKFPDHDLLHSCDNSRCVNPAHLHEGSHKMNMREASERNRLPQGEKRNFAKLKNEQVIEIRRRIKNGELNSAIAKDFNVSRQTISRIKTGETWKSI